MPTRRNKRTSDTPNNDRSGSSDSTSRHHKKQKTNENTNEDTHDNTRI